MANSIAAMAPAEGIVLGLHGVTGSGRTSVANLVRGDLAGAPNTVVLEFNPWLFAAGDDLAGRFFYQLLPALTDEGERLADARAPLDLVSLRVRLSRALRAQRTKFVIVMDDLDRLDPDRVAEVARLVKVIAAFPNLVHVLVFDRAHLPPSEVAQLVQVPFDLPLPDAGSLQQMFLDHLRELLEQYPAASVVTEDHWSQIFSPGIDSLIRTPRDVVRLMNVLRLTYPPISGEVNTVDFIAIEALRLFEPTLHDLIRRTPERFAGATRPRTAATADPATKEFHEGWIMALDPAVRLGVITLVLRLFPAVPDVQGLIIHREAPGDGARQEMLVASPELFLTYFQFVVPETAISNAEMESHLAQAGDPGAFAALLTRLASERDSTGARRVVPFLARLEDAIPTIDVSLLAPMVSGMLDVSDELRGELDTTVRSVLRSLLARLDEPQRFALLEAEMRRRQAVGWIVSEVARLGREHGRHGEAPDLPEEQRTVTLDHLAALEQVALGRIREAVSSNRLLDVPLLADVLDRWRVWDRNECLTWVNAIAADDDSLIRLVGAYLRQVRDPVAGERGLHAAYRLDPETMRPLIAPEQIVERVRRLARERAAAGDPQTALDQFVLEYELRHGHEGAGGEPEEVS